MWDSAKAVFTEKYIILNVCIEKEERLKFNYLNINLKNFLVIKSRN